MVYVRGGFDADQSIGTLQMLTNIESKLEELLAVVDVMPAEFAEQLEKAREKVRMLDHAHMPAHALER